MELKLHERVRDRNHVEGYVAAITDAMHRTARTTSFFHRGQLRGSSGSDVGCIIVSGCAHWGWRKGGLQSGQGQYVQNPSAARHWPRGSVSLALAERGP